MIPALAMESNIKMRSCMFLCTLAIVCVHASTSTSLPADYHAEVTEMQQATCQIVTDKIVATASATVSRALKGVCTSQELEKHFTVIRSEFNAQINKIHEILLKTTQKLEKLQETLSLNEEINSRNVNTAKIQPRDLEIKQKNNSIHEDSVSKKKIFSYYWKIKGVQDKIMSNKQLTLTSPKFYVNRGYRMYIKLFPHQDKGNVYVHVGLTHGDYDDRLVWPFSLKHRVVIVDQRQALTEDLMSQVWDPSILCSSSDWQKPSPIKDNEECVGFGFTQDTLYSNSYLVEDSVVIRVDVFI